MRKPIFSAFFAAMVTFSWAVEVNAPLDTIENNLDDLYENMESTLIGKDDVPLAISGYMAFRVKNFAYSEVSPAFANDKARTSVDAIFNLAVVVTPNAYMTLWTNISFPFDLSGIYTNDLATSPTMAPNEDERVLYDHSTDYTSSTVNEELNVGADIRAAGIGVFVTAGGVIWANSSPLTMWERETSPRFASQYELFEDEKTVSTYYKEKSFKPVKEGGRAFWTNRSFGGIFVNAYQLPYNMVAQVMMSQPKDMDAGTRDGLKMYGGQPGELELFGDYDFRGSVYHGRLAKTKLLGTMTLGANYMGVFFDKDIIYEPEFYRQFTTAGEDPYLQNSHIASLDVKGNVTSKLYIMADVGVSWTDSIIFTNVGDATSTGYEKGTYETNTNDPQLGVYVKAQSKYIEGWPLTAEGAYFAKDFYSPYGLTDNSRFRSWRKDEMFLNAGSLRYGANMTGLNLKLEPEFNRGRISIQYGQHRQVEEGQDVIVFNYRLNGRNMWESTNSWTKHNALFNADSGNASANARYVARTGVLSPGTGIKMDRQQGGLRGGTWEMWETFVAYDDAQQIRDSVVPSHIKWSSYLSLEAGYDIGHWFGSTRSMMMAGYASLSGISKSFTPIAYSESQKDMILWSFYGQFEPTFAVTSTFHVLGIFGLESWRAENAYVSRSVTNVTKTSQYYSLIPTGATYYEKAPINYLQTALGFGFDWDFAERAGLHFRYKWATHSDETVPENDWTGHYISAETKVWF